MRLISGLHPPLAGALTVEGKPVTGPLKSVGMAFQNSNLLPWRTALDNVLLPLEIVEPQKQDWPGTEIFRKSEKPARVGRPRRLHRQVSLGALRRHAAAHLDAARSSTSPRSSCSTSRSARSTRSPARSCGALRDLQAERRVTVMLVTHDLREAVFLADTVYVMSSRPGRIVRRCEVDIPRPRDLEVVFTQRFQDIVHELRNLIGKH